MAMPEKNVVLRQGKRRFTVRVGGVPMGYVTGVEIIRPIKERIVDGWRTAEPDGDPVVRIEVPLRYVTVEPANGPST